MKKRLLCLFLCFVMVLSVVLSGCSDKTDDEAQENISETASKNAMTLTMWVVSEETVDADIRISVTEALNAITKAKFKTQLVVNFFTEDEYYGALTKAIIAFGEAKAADSNNTSADSNEPSEEGTGEGEESTAIPDEYVTNDLGRPMIKYPEALANQVDIIYIGDLKNGDGEIYITGEEMHNEFVANGWLKALDEELKGDAKKITEYVSPTLLSAVKQQGVTYAIPNNNVIGEYTYMLLNKELMDRYSIQGYFNRGMIKNFNNKYIYQYLTLVYLNETAGENPVLPVDATYEECLELLAHYWNIDPKDYGIEDDDFSIFGTYLEDAAEVSRGEISLKFESLFENEAFVSDFLQLNKFRLNDKNIAFFKANEEEDTSGKKAAVKFLVGDQTLLTVENGVSYYKEGNTTYYVVPVKYPTAQSEDIYGNMFGVCSYTKNEKRCMEIVTYLSTNVEFRNILQYGVANVHYRLDENGKVVRLSNKNNKTYQMDLYATGNAFLAYLEPSMNADIWESGKVQNRSSLVEPLLGFDLGSFATSLDTEEEKIEIDSKEGYALSYTTGYSKAILSQNPDIKAWLDKSDSAAQKGVFFYATHDVSGQNHIYTIYVYNNAGTGTFTLEDEPIERKDAGNNGTLITVRDGVKLTAVYSDLKSGGYTLSIVSFACKNGFKVLYGSNTNGTDGNATVTDKNGKIDFDFRNTEEYQIECYEGLTVPHIMGNADLYKQVKEWYDDKTNIALTQYMLAWEDTTSSDTENYYTYVLFRQNMKHLTALEVLPVGDAGKLDLQLKFTGAETPENVMPPEYSKYMLTYIQVTTAKDVDFSYEITLNGGEDSATLVKKNATQAPDFRMYGNLDTELIKYMDRLNKEVLTLLDGCTTYAELETLVKCLQIMLRTSSRMSINDLKAVDNAVANKLNTMANNLIGGTGGFDSIYSHLRQAVNYETMDIVGGGDKQPWPDQNGTETYVYYDSPYGIYYKWMQTYGYLPTETAG